MARLMYAGLPLYRLISARYNTLASLEQLVIPKLIAHSTEDAIIPFAMGCQLFAAAAPPKRFIVLTGGHNDSAWTDNYRQAVREFVDETLSSATK